MKESSEQSDGKVFLFQQRPWDYRSGLAYVFLINPYYHFLQFLLFFFFFWIAQVLFTKAKLKTSKWIANLSWIFHVCWSFWCPLRGQPCLVRPNTFSCFCVPSGRTSGRIGEILPSTYTGKKEKIYFCRNLHILKSFFKSESHLNFFF